MILIIGAGLSGLLTGLRLKQAGIPFKILEARNRIGGRVNTLYKSNTAPIEMGATWFHPQHKNLISLLDELGVTYFEQHKDNTVFYQKSDIHPTQIVQVPEQPPSYRIYGGTSNLLNQLFERLDRNSVLMNQPVTQINSNESAIQILARETFEATTVVLALPPKLWANKIRFQPALPDTLLRIAKSTHTWMEDSIKIGLSYDQPFWQQDKIPATLYSNSGPITEFYDHSNAEKSSYALCGFINPSLKSLSYLDRRERVTEQLRTVFGEKALAFTHYEECIWSNEEHTGFDTSNFLYPHQNNGNAIFKSTLFNDTLLISSSESASEFPGYMDGAVYAGNAIAEKLIKSVKKTP